MMIGRVLGVLLVVAGLIVLFAPGPLGFINIVGAGVITVGVIDFLRADDYYDRW
jgi:hypothetical protein